MTVILPPISGRIVATRGARLPLVVGGAGIAASGVLLLSLDVDTPLPLVVAAYVVFGIGFGMVNPPITNTAVSGMPVAQAGVAAGVASTSRQVGSALGVAVLGSLVTALLGASLATGFAVAARPAWIVVIGCGLVVLALGLASTTSWARETARRTAGGFAAAAPVVVVSPAPAPTR
jgi:MFS family permease